MRQLIRRFAVLGSTSLVTQLISFLTLAIVARRVTPGDLGSYTVALSIVTFISIPQSMGVTMVGTRDVAREPERAAEIAGEVFVLQMNIAVIGYVAVLLLAPVVAPNHEMRTLFPIVGVFLFTGTSFEWALQALGDMRGISIARIAGQVLYGALVPLLVVRGRSAIETYTWLLLGGLAVKHLFTTFFLVRRAGIPDLRVGPRQLRKRLRASMALGYASVVGQVYGTIDQIMLGYFSTAADAGQYAAANRLPGAIGTFASSWTAVLYPHSARVGHDHERLRTDAGRILSVVALFVVPLVACTPFVAHGLMVAVFGGQYAAGSTTFALLTVALGLVLVDGTMLTLLMGLGRDRMMASRITITALVNVILNLILIPLYGRNAAAINSIASELLGFLLMLRGFKTTIGGIRPEWARLGRIVIAVVPAVVVLAIVPSSVLVWLRVAVGAAVYLAGTVVFGAVSRTEIRTLFMRRQPLSAAGASDASG